MAGSARYACHDATRHPYSLQSHARQRNFPSMEYFARKVFLHSYATTDECRETELGNVTSPEGESDANREGDRRDNFGPDALNGSSKLFLQWRVPPS